MLYSYGSFLSKITLSLLCIVVPVLYESINPSKKISASCLENTNNTLIILLLFIVNKMTKSIIIDKISRTSFYETIYCW